MNSLLLLALVTSVLCIHPVLLLHGHDANATRLLEYEDWIKQVFPDAVMYSADMGGKKASDYVNLMTTVDVLFQEVIPHKELFKKGGFNIIAHSQGTIIGRGFIEKYGHLLPAPVLTFISLAGVQEGIYGDGLVPEAWLYPLVSKLVYTDSWQKGYSFAGYWKDPKRYEEYLEHCWYLPVINNERSGHFNETFRTNFAAVQRMVATYGTTDEVVEPKETGVFQYYEIGSTKKVQDLKDSEQYQKDTFGLRTLDESGRLILLNQPFKHVDWISGPLGHAYFNSTLSQLLL